ncbi:MAG: NAD-dependent epimerase [Flammeovirgaceae bacterium]
MPKILVTGSAGFIGFHLCHKLLSMGYQVVGVDNLNEYYDVSLKEARNIILKKNTAFSFFRIDISVQSEVEKLFKNQYFDYVVNLAAQAGVRHSIENPHVYLQSNVVGFLNILEGCRYASIKHLVYASSSSIYGANRTLPFSKHHPVDHPLALYAVTKRTNELMAHSYSVLYKLPTTGLRFFSAYGPYGRPDMALFIFTKSIIEGSPINIFNQGKMKRDFTYIDDLVECIVRLIPKPAKPNPDWDALNPDPATSFAPYRLFNVGNTNSIELMRYIELIEKKIGKKASKNFMPIQEGDIPEALADVGDLVKEIDFCPSTSIEEGINKFIDWYISYYNIKM